jgi:hypothetical protein
MVDRRGFQKNRPKMENGNNEMKEKKLNIDRKEDTKGMPSKDQARTTHGSKMERIGNPLCPFCNTDLSVDHILWECKETEDQRTSIDMNKEHWINGKKVWKR